MGECVPEPNRSVLAPLYVINIEQPQVSRWEHTAPTSPRVVCGSLTIEIEGEPSLAEVSPFTGKLLERGDACLANRASL
jgi:hypothetical protein